MANPPETGTDLATHLGDLLRQHGPGLIEDRSRLSMLLRQRAPGEFRSIHLLLTAVDAGVPSRLLEAGPERSAVETGQEVTQMVDNFGTSPELARSAVEIWARALARSSQPAGAAAAPSGTEWVGLPEAEERSSTGAAGATPAAPVAPGPAPSGAGSPTPAPTLAPTPGPTPGPTPVPPPPVPPPLPQRPPEPVRPLPLAGAPPVQPLPGSAAVRPLPLPPDAAAVRPLPQPLPLPGAPPSVQPLPGAAPAAQGPAGRAGGAQRWWMAIPFTLAAIVGGLWAGGLLPGGDPPAPAPKPGAGPTPPIPGPKPGSGPSPAPGPGQGPAVGPKPGAGPTPTPGAPGPKPAPAASGTSEEGYAIASTDNPPTYPTQRLDGNADTLLYTFGLRAGDQVYTYQLTAAFQGTSPNGSGLIKVVKGGREAGTGEVSVTRKLESNGYVGFNVTGLLKNDFGAPSICVSTLAGKTEGQLNLANGGGFFCAFNTSPTGTCDGSVRYGCGNLQAP